MIERTWQRVVDEMANHGTDSTRARCHRAMECKAFEPLRSKIFVQTTSEDLLSVLRGANNSTAFYSRRIHNLALDFGSLPWLALDFVAWRVMNCDCGTPSLC